jgi:hypothetical protein
MTDAYFLEINVPKKSFWVSFDGFFDAITIFFWEKLSLCQFSERSKKAGLEKAFLATVDMI